LYLDGYGGDGGDRAWYYWYSPFGRYLPLDFIDLYPPDDSGDGTDYDTL
jgi:hypothetical protein